MRIQISIIKATNEDISLLEELVASKIPEDYRDFLLGSNGGSVVDFDEDEYVQIWRTNGDQSELVDVTGLAVFYNLLKDDEYSLYSNMSDRIKVFPKLTLPIAEDALGNVLLISLRYDSYGFIYFWYHDGLPYGTGEVLIEQNAFEYLCFVAGSFTELSSLVRLQLS